MKQSAKKLFSLALALAMTLTLFTASLTVNAEEKELGTVKVIVKNDTFSTADSAPWEGVLIDGEVKLQNDSSMMSVVKHAMTDKKVSYSFNNYNYLATVNGLSEYAANGSGGWMMTLNDWFTSEGSTSYTVANNGIKDDWTVTINPQNVDGKIGVIPEAYNKNYQVKTYLNKYTPEQPGTELKALTRKLDVKKGDIIYIGVGNNNWETMNQKANETVYKLTVDYANMPGDVDCNGIVNINDATLLQKFIAKAVKLNAYQQKIADCNNDGRLTIADVTAIQKIIAKAA